MASFETRSDGVKVNSKPRKPGPRPAIAARLLPGPNTPDVLAVSVGKAKPTYYYLRCLPTDFGRAFRLEKFSIQGGESYDVLLDCDKSTCECLGHLRWQTWCKHIQALRQLESAGKLPPAPKPAFRSAAEFAAADPAGYEAMMREFPTREWPPADEDAEAERRYSGEE
jgi:hypothetical protein